LNTLGVLPRLTLGGSNFNMVAIEHAWRTATPHSRRLKLQHGCNWTTTTRRSMWFM